MAPPTLWTPEQDATLRQLWAEGHSMTQIGKRMSRTKGSIVGRVHRLRLPERESPPLLATRALPDGAYEERIAKVLPLLEQGLTIAQAADAAGLTFHQARDAYRRHRKPPPPRRVIPTHAPRAVIPAPQPAPEKPQAGGSSLPLSPRVAPSAPPAVSGHPPVAPSLWKTCQWPTASKATGRIAFECSDAPQPGRPYCPVHSAIAYVPHVARPRAA